jgi:hypothetical protein
MKINSIGSRARRSSDIKPARPRTATARRPDQTHQAPETQTAYKKLSHSNAPKNAPTRVRPDWISAIPASITPNADRSMDDSNNHVSGPVLTPVKKDRN